MDGFKARVRLYDYGVVSIALTRPFCGSWSDLVGSARRSSRATSRTARRSDVSNESTGSWAALTGLRPTFLTEDYLVYVVHELNRPANRRRSCSRSAANRLRRCCVVNASR